MDRPGLLAARSSRWLVSLVAACSLSLGLLGSPAGARSVSSGPPGTPNPGTNNVLDAVSARSASDVWAVGNTDQDTLILHWNGTRWSRFASPSPGTNDKLTGVSAVSAADVWAVGYYEVPCDFGARQKTLILHWNGASWSQVPSPNPGTCDNELDAVSADSATDAWAVGFYATPGDRSLILHWDGTAWSRVRSPNATGFDNVLNGVSAVSATDAWAVGVIFHNAACFCTVALHWDGVSWSRVPSPSPGSVASQLNGVSADSATDAWAVGWQDPGAANYKTLILRWNGANWSQVPSPNPNPSAPDVLNGVSARSATDAWAVGEYTDKNVSSQSDALILHWNGTRWSKAPTPIAPAPQLALYGASTISATNAWAVGQFGISARTLALHWNGTSWSRT